MFCSGWVCENYGWYGGGVGYCKGEKPAMRKRKICDFFGKSIDIGLLQFGLKNPIATVVYFIKLAPF
jgi:hypothetical protein